MEVALRDIAFLQADAPLRECGRVSLPAFAAGAGVLRAADRRDASVPLADQALHCRHRPAEVLGEHSVEPAVPEAAVDQYNGNMLCLKSGQRAAQRLAARLYGNDEHPAHALCAHGRKIAALLLRAVLGTAQKDVVPVFVRRIGDAAQQMREKRVLNIGYKKADAARIARTELARHCIRRIVELRNRLDDTALRGLTHIRAAVHHA